MTESMTCFLSECIQVVACRNSKNWSVSAPVFLLNCLSGVGWEEGLLSKEWSTVNARLKCIRNARVLTPNCIPGLVLLCPQWFLRWKQKQICLHFFEKCHVYRTMTVLSWYKSEWGKKRLSSSSSPCHDFSILLKSWFSCILFTRFWLILHSRDPQTNLWAE